MKAGTALVTGAASGIGFAIAEDLAKQGLKVWVTDLKLELAEAAAEKMGSHASALKLDVTSQDDIDAAVSAVQDAGGRLDILVNNAGIQHVAPIEEFPVHMWKLINDVLLVGPAMLTRAFVPLMKSNNFGRVVNIGSIHGIVASPFKSAYVAAKHGLIGFSKVIALETAEYDITVNTICPAYVRTPLVDKQIKDQAAAHNIPEEQVVNDIMLAPMPKKQFVSLEELCSTVRYVVSDAARTMTAQAIVLDGGWVAK